MGLLSRRWSAAAIRTGWTRRDTPAQVALLVPPRTQEVLNPDTIIFVLEIIGTLAFPSGAMTAVKKNMDVFGVIILGLTTAVGAGDA